MTQARHSDHACVDGDDNCMGEDLNDPSVVKANRQTFEFVLEKVLPTVKSKPSVLEIGCGAGHLLSFMRDHCGRLVGVDPALNCVKHAREISGAEVIHGYWPEVQPDGQFDVILVTYVLHGIAISKRAAFLDACAAALAPGGAFVLADFDVIESERYAKAAAGLLSRAGCKTGSSFQFMDEHDGDCCGDDGDCCGNDGDCCKDGGFDESGFEDIPDENEEWGECDKAHVWALLRC